MQLNSGNILMWKGYENKSKAGVRFLINRNIAGNVKAFTALNERVAKITIQLNKSYKIQVVQVYAPTTSHSDEMVEKFYEDINKAVDREKCNMTILMEDFNAKVGTSHPNEQTKNVGRFGLGLRNARGERLIEFANQKYKNS